jgi:hypothetical protein
VSGETAVALLYKIPERYEAGNGTHSLYASLVLSGVKGQAQGQKD